MFWFLGRNLNLALQEQKVQEKKQDSMNRFMKDLSLDSKRSQFEKWGPSAEEEIEEDDYDDDGDYIDQSTTLFLLIPTY